MTDTRPLEPGLRLADVICPQCEEPFRLRWERYAAEPCTLCLRGCPSGGIYDVSIECPYCDYKEDL
jgi:hypothetical protein